MMAGRLEGLAAVITGSSRGIGRVTAERFIAEGAHVVVHGTDAMRTCEAARKMGAACCAGDVRERETSDALVKTCLDSFGRIDVFIANAGLVRMKPFLEFDEASWRESMEVNVSGAMYGCQAAARAMAESGKGGRLITVSTIGANMGQFGFTGYGTSKAALLGLTRVMAVELASAGITANCIVPGPVMNDMLLSLYGEQRLSERRKTIPMGRLAEAAEVASMAVFLASQEAGYITGQTFVIDGGASAAGCYTMEVFRRANEPG
jgi:NAD(P)-dependent dehydrogenase (short-subunit alcohol dehydrogenase family)